MAIYGYIIVIKRLGGDYTSYPLTTNECIIGRYDTCDIRVQLPAVSKIHCSVKIDNLGNASLTNLTAHNFTIVNDETLAGLKTIKLFHNDVIRIADRKFRWEYPEGSKLFFTSRSEQPSHLAGWCEGANVQRSLEERDRSKKVSFGPYLSPEHFDLNFPPSTPVRKGQKPPELDELTFSQDKLSPKISSVKTLNNNCMNETPSKSLLKRHSPTPIKPSIAKRLGLFTNLSSSPQNSIAGNIDNAELSTLKRRGTKRKRNFSLGVATRPSKRMRLRKSTGSQKISKAMSTKSTKNVKKKRFSDAVIRGNVSKIPLTKSQRSHAILHYKVQQRKVAKKVASQKKATKLKMKRSSNHKSHTCHKMQKEFQAEPPIVKATNQKISPAQRSPASRLTSVVEKTIEKKSPGRPKSIGIASVTPNLRLTSAKRSPTSKLTTVGKKSPGRPKSIGNTSATPNPKFASIKRSPISKLTSVKKKSPGRPKSIGYTSVTPKPKSASAKRSSVSKLTSVEKMAGKMSPGRPKSIGNACLIPNTKLTSIKRSPDSKLTSVVKKTGQPKSAGRSKSVGNASVTPNLKLISPAKKSPVSKLTSVKKKMAENKSPGRPKSIGNISVPANHKKISLNTSLPSKLKSLRLSLSATPVSKRGTSTSPKSLPASKSVQSPPNISASKSEQISGSPQIFYSKTLSHSNRSSKMTIQDKKLSNSLQTSLTALQNSFEASDTPQSTRSLPTSQRANNLSKSGIKISNVRSSRSRGRPKNSSLSNQRISQRINVLDDLKLEVTSNELTPLKCQSLKSTYLPEKSTSERLSTSLRKAARTNGASPKSPTRLLVLSRKTVNSPPRVSTSVGLSPNSLLSPNNCTEHLVPAETNSRLDQSSEMFSISPNSNYSSSFSPCTPQSGRKSRLSDISFNISLPNSDLTPNRKMSSLISIVPDETSIDFSFSKTPNITMDKFVSPIESSNSPVRMVPESISRLTNNPVKENVYIPLESDMTLFEFDTRVTPDVSGVVSPLNTTQKQSNKSHVQPLQDCNMTKSIQKLFESSDKTDAAQLRKLFTESITPQKDNVVEESVLQSPHLSNRVSRTSPNLDKPLKKLRVFHGMTNDSFSNRSYERQSSLKENFKSGMNQFQRSFNIAPESSHPNVTDLKNMKSSPTKETLKANSTLLEGKQSVRTSKSPKLNSSGVGITGPVKEPRPGPLSPKVDDSNVSFKHLIKISTPEYVSTKADYSNVYGLRRLMKTPRPPAESPKADYSNVHGLRKLMKTPRPQAESPKADYSNVHGIKRLIKTPRPQAESPKADYSNVHGIKRLIKTPRPQAESPIADYSNVHGIKRLIKTPRPQAESPKADYSNVHGIKRLMKTPRPQAESPKADYSNVHGIKRLMKTPRPQAESPKADYSNVHGIKRLIRAPRPQAESPKADYSNVHGIKRLMKTPRPQAESPKADYSNVHGIRRLMKTPRPEPESPKADYSNVYGLRRLMKTPRPQAESPKADYSNVHGIRRLMKTPRSESPKADYLNIYGLRRPQSDSSKADYSNVHALKRLMKSPKLEKVKSESNYNFDAVKRLLKMHKSLGLTSHTLSINACDLKTLTQSPNLDSSSTLKKLLRSLKLENMNDINTATLIKLAENAKLGKKRKSSSEYTLFDLKRLFKSPQIKTVSDIKPSEVQGLEDILHLFTTPPTPFNSPSSGSKSPKHNASIHSPEMKVEACASTPSLQINKMLTPQSPGQSNKQREGKSLTPRTRGTPKKSPSLMPRTRGMAKKSPSLMPHKRGRPIKSPSLMPRTRGRPKKSSSMTPDTKGGLKKSPSITPDTKGGPKKSPSITPDTKGGPKKSPSITLDTKGGPKKSSMTPDTKGGPKKSPSIMKPDIKGGPKKSPSMTPDTKGGPKKSSSMTPDTKGGPKKSPSIMKPDTKGEPKKSPSMTPYTKGGPNRKSASSTPRARNRIKKNSNITPKQAPQTLTVEELPLLSKSQKKPQTPSPTKSILNKPKRQARKRKDMEKTAKDSPQKRQARKRSDIEKIAKDSPQKRQTRKRRDIEKIAKDSPQKKARCMERKKIPVTKSLEIESMKSSTASPKPKVVSPNSDAPVPRTTRGRKAKNPDSSVQPIASKSPVTRTTRAQKAKNPDSSVLADAPKCPVVSPPPRLTRSRKKKVVSPKKDSPRSPEVNTPPKRNTRQRKALPSRSPQISSRTVRATRSRR